MIHIFVYTAYGFIFGFVLKINHRIFVHYIVIYVELGELFSSKIKNLFYLLFDLFFNTECKKKKLAIISYNIGTFTTYIYIYSVTCAATSGDIREDLFGWHRCKYAFRCTHISYYAVLNVFFIFELHNIKRGRGH